MAGKLLYLDSSAIVKLVVPEPETRALRELLRSWPERVSSGVARIEVEQVARRIGAVAVRRARSVLSRIALVDLDEDVVQRAAALNLPELRTLHAIHLAGDGDVSWRGPGSLVRLRRSPRWRRLIEDHRRARSGLSARRDAGLWFKDFVARELTPADPPRARDGAKRSRNDRTWSSPGSGREGGSLRGAVIA